MFLYYELSFLVGGVAALFLSLFVYLKNRNSLVNKTFSLLSLSGAVWSLGFFMQINSQTFESAYFWRTFMDSGAILLPAFWMHFVYSVTNRLLNRKILFACYLGSIFILILNLSDSLIPGLFIKGLEEKNLFQFYVTAGFGYYPFLLFFWLVVTYSIFLLFKEYKRSSGLKAQQIKYIIFGALSGFSGGGMSFLLSFGIPVPPYGIIFFAFYPVIIAYAIVRYHFLDIKVIATELSIVAIWIFLLTRIFLSASLLEYAVNIVLFVFVFIFSVLLAKSVWGEVRQREELERVSSNLSDLKDNLEVKIQEQTVEIKRAYEVEKKARIELEELDKAKDQFILTTQHHLRTPLTIIKGYLAVLKEKFSLPKEALDALGEMQGSAESMSQSVNNLLKATEVRVREKL